MMATVPHVTSGSGLRKFQADGFLLDRVHKTLISPCDTYVFYIGAMYRELLKLWNTFQILCRILFVVSRNVLYWSFVQLIQYH